MRVFVGKNVLLGSRSLCCNIVLIPSRTIVSLAQPFDLALESIEPACDIPAHVLDDACACGDIRAIQRSIAPVTG
jgi:hypothetical protein